MNSTNMTGHIGNDLELRTTPSGGKPRDSAAQLPQPEDYPEPPEDADAPGDLPF